ncbi:hypothetical protein [Gillisia hiemivivida]|uniref:Uncharacterized protein n=1 Tax=Gillisia hiemivivida TaxID=291190 RepID=A0A5C6ZR49_9FLAO|nr:hypothetical protein [Gillisia hiemivivida]TXD92851.1 hypothetical protein ES724_12245 [Gillisia hiemivivida]
MNREQYAELINKLEESYPVNDWKIKGVNVWPLIKMRLSFAYHNSSTKKHTETRLAKLRKIFIGIFYIVKFFFTKKNNKQAKLFCLAPHFRYYDGRKFINRYFNRLIDDCLKSDSSFYFAEYGNTKSFYRKNLDYPDVTIYLEGIKYISLIIREFTWKKHLKDSKWEHFEDFIEEVNDKLGRLTINKSDIVKQFAYIDLLKYFYKKVLFKYNVQEIYILCYYVSEMYAMNLAASEMNLSNYDIQHGGQGNLHFAYANYNVVPLKGYKLLPKYFWVWNRASGDEIENWTRKQNYHKVFHGGNPWIDYCIKNLSPEVSSGKKIILYTLQPIGEKLIDEYIIEAIKKTPRNYVWWLRLHPRQLGEKSKLEQVLFKEGINCLVNIEDATKLPLPGILNETSVHLSKFSGSILEAFMMSKKSIILSSIGVETYPEVVDSEYGIVYLGTNSDVLLELILKNS